MPHPANAVIARISGYYGPAMERMRREPAGNGRAGFGEAVGPAT